jgi:hypothetical protein
MNTRLSSLRSGTPSLTLRTASEGHEGLWKVPARGQPGQIATTSITGRHRASRDPPSLTTGLGQPHGVAHTSHNPGDELKRSS